MNLFCNSCEDKYILLLLLTKALFMIFAVTNCRYNTVFRYFKMHLVYNQNIKITPNKLLFKYKKYIDRLKDKYIVGKIMSNLK